MAANACPVCFSSAMRYVCPARLDSDYVRDVYECPDCGAAFYHPTPSADDVARCDAPAWVGTFFMRYWQDYYQGRSLARRLSHWRTSGDFLGTSCALGTMLAGLRDHSNWRARGLESSTTIAELGRGLNGVDITSGSLPETPYPPGSFDYILLSNVLEREPSPRAAIASVARMLRPGGRLELIVPNGPVDLLPNRTLSRRWGRPAHTRHGGHLFFFSRHSLLGLLESFGLRVVSLRCFHVKLGMKARGWLPRSYKNFKIDTCAEAAAAKVEKLSLEQGRAMIPPRPSWPRYCWGDRLRRLWRFRDSEFGYDFEVMAEKL